MENRAFPSPDRWHEGSNRNSGHEARRDSKWSSRWGPEDKEKESRTEKRTDVDKEKDDAHYDNQSSIVSNRSASERDSDSRDKRKLDSSFAAMPDEMEECLPITQSDIIEPLAFVSPDAEEEGKITSSGVVYNSFRKGWSTENVSGNGDYESNEGKLGILPSVPVRRLLIHFKTPQTMVHIKLTVTWPPPFLYLSEIELLIILEKEVDHEGNKVTADEVTATVLECDVAGTTKEIVNSSRVASQIDICDNGQIVNSALTAHFHSDRVDSTSSFDVKSKLPDDSNSLFVLPLRSRP
ncbi:hypothetical protein GH714_029990 [Hevea brasiliensis]|uniref:Uncharacterized protein n=1 Tax=Hevea brasiliensis TaxID=3981 RepID=A0A6A6KV83_HEVBR|nr:hypothetical protein GH714_029990 [Hevea brasiliensis]